MLDVGGIQLGCTASRLCVNDVSDTNMGGIQVHCIASRLCVRVYLSSMHPSKYPSRPLPRLLQVTANRAASTALDKCYR